MLKGKSGEGRKEDERSVWRQREERKEVGEEGNERKHGK